MQTPSISVRISRPWPSTAPPAIISVDPRVTAISRETQLPGGFARARVGLLPPDARYDGLVYPFLPDPVDVEDRSHVVISSGALVLFEGVVVRTAPNRRGFECEGYGVWASKQSSLPYGSATRVTSGLMVAEALAANPWLVVSHVDDPGVNHAWSEVVDRTATDIVQQVCTEGGLLAGQTSNTPFMFTVYEDRLARCLAMGKPALADYTLSYDPTVMDITWDYSGVVDAVQVVYTDPTGARRVAGPFYRAGYDAAYPPRVMTLSGNATATGAAALALTTLAQHSTPMLAGTIRLADHQGMRWRAGEVIGMAGYGGPADDMMTYITATTHDDMQGTASITVGQPSTATLPGFIAQSSRVMRALLGKRDPNTGARSS